MIRKGKKYLVDEILDKVLFEFPHKRIEIDGDFIKMTSERLQLFASKGTTCVNCGLKAKYFVKEKHLESEKYYHFNLYGIKNGEEVLFTKDHIKPVSLGGTNELKNYQVMCHICNENKGNNMKNRKLASIQKIKEINPIPNADMIERATILGWHLVVKKDEFKPGDLCIYCEVDSLLPVKSEFEFLRKSCYNPRLDGFRIKTVRMRGQISQGIAFPLSIIPQDILDSSLDLKEGQDLTEFLEIKKYEAPISADLAGKAKGSFPSFIPKTDEIRIQSIPNVLERYKERRFVLTEKLDGTSCTYYVLDNYFGICGRNLEFLPTTENTYNCVAKAENIEEKLKSFNKNIAIQGEIIGPGIQGNKYKLTKHKFYAFNVFNIDKHEYLDYGDFITFCKHVGFEHVPIINDNFILNHSVDELVEISQKQSTLFETHREGLVFRLTEEENDFEIGRVSFKVINPKFLLKYEKDEK